MKTAQELNSLALETRRMLGEDIYSPIDIFAVVNGWKEMKITLLSYPLSQRISGMCTRVDDDIVIFDHELMKNLDKDLDDFLDELLKD